MALSPATQTSTKGGTTDKETTGPRYKNPDQVLKEVTQEFKSVAEGKLVLHEGHQGEKVRVLQRMLNKWAADHKVEGTKVDGDFGPKTERLLEAFQKANGLAENGVGKQTLSKLKELHLPEVGLKPLQDQVKTFERLRPPRGPFRDTALRRGQEEPAKVDAQTPKKEEEPAKVDAQTPKKEEEPAKVDAQTPKKEEEPAKVDAQTPKKEEEPAKVDAQTPKKEEEPAKVDAQTL